jgi:FAD:protein FMN transferase
MRKNARKNIIYSIILLLMVFLVYLYRNNQVQPESAGIQDEKVTLTGPTMGTTYRIVYLDAQKRDFKKEIDSLLSEFNQSLSTYVPDSEISRFNRGDSIFFDSPFFLRVLEVSKEVHEKTGGAFDPTIGPLVNAWGFGPEGAEMRDSSEIKELLSLVDFALVEFDQQQVKKKKSQLYLDFSAIAKGYGVDVVSDWLEAQGVEDMLIEIGGELVARGKNEKGELWRVGVSQPDGEGLANDLYGVIMLENKGMATSGNYRNFYLREGKKYSHTISPFTGFPVEHGLLSTTVVAKDCMTADAYATAMMVLGTEKSIELQKEVGDIEILLIYNDEAGDLKSYVSEGLKPNFSFINQEQ